MCKNMEKKVLNGVELAPEISFDAFKSFFLKRACYIYS